MPRQTECIDAGWQFCLADRIAGMTMRQTRAEQSLLKLEAIARNADGINWLKAGRSYGPAARESEDVQWRTVDLPHDWSVESTPRPEDHHRNGFLRAGVGWYRKTLTLATDQVGDDRRVALRFDGVFRDATVFVNGHLVGQNQSGYIGFVCDISDVVEPGDNTIAVCVNATAKEGWFYEGAGIYRHVWLVTSRRLRIADDGVRIDPAVCGASDGPSADLRVSVELVNDRDAPAEAHIMLTVLDPAGQAVATGKAAAALAAGDVGVVHAQDLKIAQAQLWSLQARHRYTLVVEVSRNDETTDRTEVRFGLRTIRFDKDRGFFLNEQPVKLKGVCCHQDHAGVGMAIPDALQRWRLERLVEMGCNAYRTSHNPPTPELLELCDELGILVMDETRCFGISDEAVSQLERLVRRDRHHPSVILWSLANEEMVVQVTDVGRRMYAKLKRVAKRHDASRPFTAAINNDWDLTTGFIEAEDIHGLNYLPNASLDKLRAARPDLPILVAEASSEVSTRGEYATDPAAGVVAEYDDHTQPIHEHVTDWPFWGQASEASWKAVGQHDYLAGTFIWTGFDYRGEQTPYSRWPSVGSHFGIMDLCGFPKDRFYYYQAWWSNRDVLHVLPHWTWPGRNGQLLDVWAFTNCASAELFLNGASQGVRSIERNGHAEWKVAYQPGVLEIVGQTVDGREVRHRAETAGAPHAIRLCADRPQYLADGRDVAIVTAAVVDAQGQVVPYASHDLRFTLDGDARIVGLGNGDPNSHEHDQPQRGIGFRRAYHGLAQVLVQTPRQPCNPTLHATAAGLRPVALTLITATAH